MTKTHANYFFFTILTATIVLAILIILPILSPLVLALAFSVIFTPFHRWVVGRFFHGKENSGLAALVTVVILAFIVLVPLFLVLYTMYGEVRDVYLYMTDDVTRAQAIDTFNRSLSYVSNILPGTVPALSIDSINIVDILKNIASWIIGHIDAIFASVYKIAIGLFVMALALFYFFRDGAELRRYLIMLSPLSDVDDEHIIAKLEKTIRAIFMGSIMVGIVQGLLTGIGFTIFGVPSPAVWGGITVIAALIPGIGTALVLIPGVLYLVVTGMTAQAIGLAIWGVVAVGLIDNFLGPIFMNRGVKIHPFLILVSVLGGLTFFGAIGLVLGPLTLALLISLLEIYSVAKKQG